MSLFKRLTALTSITACLSIMAPAVTGYAKTGGSDSIPAHHLVQKALPNASVHTISISKPGNRIGNMDHIYGKGLLRLGDTNLFVATVQEHLERMGYYKGRVDGIFGKLTFQAVEGFQMDQHIGVDGIVGPVTKASLYQTRTQKRTPQEKQVTFAQPQHKLKTKTDKTQLMNQPQVSVKTKTDKNVPAQTETKKATAGEQKSSSRVVTQTNTKQFATKTYTKTGGTQSQKPASPAVSQTNTKQSATKSYTQSHQQESSSTSSQSQYYSGNAHSSSITVEATGYALTGRTATGVDLGSNTEARVVAVDPSVIPLGSTIEIPGYGTYTAADTGGNIKGNRIDIHFSSNDEAINFGRKTFSVKVRH
ncbi:hypothetical protein EWI07_09365 [Sporolactobacillus sp. THM7-4]|nr:hypothetical protein EWI07_09365 [Sporolactobacillus sp. THM7-4]